uniref:Calpastatin n=1 Tax=Sphenodon punctatus TaxID=8508 RepID=A0A8D0GF92_SPHPU
MAFASWWYAVHGDKKKGGASSVSGDKKGSDASEKKSASSSVSQPPKTQTSGATSNSKMQPHSTVETKAPATKPAETKETSSPKQTSGLQSRSRKRNKIQSAQRAKTEPGKAEQSTKSDASQAKQAAEEKHKEPGGAKSKTKPSVVTGHKQPSTKKVASGQTDQALQVTSIEEAKPKSDNKSLAGKAALAAAGTVGAVAAAGLVAATDKPSTEAKESKPLAPSPAAEVAANKSSEKSDLDTALDDLIDTLGSPEENVPPSPVYTEPEVTDPCSSVYIEELGKRESTIPPEYRKLLEGKGNGKAGPTPKAEEESQKKMTDDELADALSSGFTCSDTPGGEKNSVPKEKKPAGEGDFVQAQATSLASSSVPPKEKKPRLEEPTISDSALDALADTLGAPEPEPEEDLSSIVEVSEAKAKEKKIEKAGERDDTIPPEYRLKEDTDKDGKPLLPKSEEKPKPMSDSDLVDDFSKDFVCPAPPAAQSKPSTATDPPKKHEAAAPPKAAAGEVVSSAAVSSVQSSAPSSTASSGNVPDEALEALSGSLGKREPLPEENKPAVDKVKEKTKQEEREKLGEDEETIPPEYRLIEIKDKDGKPLLPKPEEKPQPLSESELLDALSEGFSCSPAPTSLPVPTPASKKSADVKSSATASEEVVSSTVASAVQSSAPLPAAVPSRKELDDALGLLSDSLGQREPDPDENKPVVDKVKEKAKSEHRDKLGERDDTIPPDYRHLLDSDEKGKPIKPAGKDGGKSQEPKKPGDDSAAIDALSGDFDSCPKPPATQQSSAKDKSGKDATATKPATKDEGKPKDPKTAKEQPSSAKSEKQKTS